LQAAKEKKTKTPPPIPFLPCGIIDSHAHVIREFFGEDRDDYISEAHSMGIKQFVNPGVTTQGLEELIEIIDRYPYVYGAAGQHPHDAKDFDERAMADLQRAMTHPKMVAVGECGLDYHYNNSPREVQIEAFRAQLRLAASLDKPVIIHCRDAWDDAFALLREMVETVGGVKGVFHCFTGGPEHLEMIAELDFYVSFSGILTYANAKSIQAAAPLVPADRFLVETDCPFLAPQKVRGEKNKPPYVWFTAQKLAELRNVTLERVAIAATQNAQRLFNLPLV